jgi:hypothetical protein
MKKFLSLLLILFSFTGFSQTLTQSFNEPVIGDNQPQYDIDTSAYSAGMPIAVTGSTAVWNFTSLVAHTPSFATSYVSPATVSNSANYPGCTVVSVSYMLTTFLKSVNSGTTQQTEILGLSSNTLNVTFTNSAIAAKFPMSYGSSSTDNMAGTFSGFSQNGTCNGNITTTADGLGTLNLPGGISLTNVLRVKSVQNLSMLLSGFPVGSAKQTIYNYYHSSQKFPIISINYTYLSIIGQNPSTSSFVNGSVSHFTAVATGISENAISNDDVMIYPNPAGQNVYFDIKKSANPIAIKVYNQIGAEIYSAAYSDHLDISGFKGGMYVIEIKTDKGFLIKKIIKD